jgi:hypothetical protein
MDFEGFLKMLKVGSYSSLDALEQYDPRLSRSADLDASVHEGGTLGAGGGGDGPSVHGGARLEVVPEHG